MVNVLRFFQQRKGMYVLPLTVDSVVNFLNGFQAACRVFGVEELPDARGRVYKQRKWKCGAAALPITEMRKKGWTDEQIMDELIEINIALLRAHSERGVTK